MNALIIDDDISNIELVVNLIEKYSPDIKVIGKADTVELALKLIISLKPDLLFLDIELHNKTAFDILQVIETENLQVILITAHEKYALASYKYDITDYLLKPIQDTEFVHAIQTCKKNTAKVTKQIKYIPQDNFLAVDQKNEISLFDLNEIIHLTAENSYTYIHLNNKPSILSSKSLKEYEAKLPSHLFSRIHHSYIVNLKHIVKFTKKKPAYLLMSNGEELPISENRKKALLNKIII